MQIMRHIIQLQMYYEFIVAFLLDVCRERLYLQILFCLNNKNRTMDFLYYKYGQSPWEEHVRFPKFRLLTASKYTLGISELGQSSECQLRPLPNKHILPSALLTSHLPKLLPCATSRGKTTLWSFTRNSSVIL